MGDIVHFPIRPAASTQGGSNESDSDSRPDLGKANLVYDFYTWEPVPGSGFPVKDKDGRLLVLVFSPIVGRWSEAANKQRMLAVFSSVLSLAGEVRWAGHKYRICDILDSDVLMPGVAHPEHIGKLCVQLVVEEIKE